MCRVPAEISSCQPPVLSSSSLLSPRLSSSLLVYPPRASSWMGPGDGCGRWARALGLEVPTAAGRRAAGSPLRRGGCVPEPAGAALWLARRVGLSRGLFDGREWVGSQPEPPVAGLHQVSPDCQRGHGLARRRPVCQLAVYPAGRPLALVRAGGGPPPRVCVLIRSPMNRYFFVSAGLTLGKGLAYKTREITHSPPHIKTASILTGRRTFERPGRSRRSHNSQPQGRAPPFARTRGRTQRRNLACGGTLEGARPHRGGLLTAKDNSFWLAYGGCRRPAAEAPPSPTNCQMHRPLPRSSPRAHVLSALAIRTRDDSVTGSTKSRKRGGAPRFPALEIRGIF